MGAIRISLIGARMDDEAGKRDRAEDKHQCQRRQQQARKLVHLGQRRGNPWSFDAAASSLSSFFDSRSPEVGTFTPGPGSGVDGDFSALFGCWRCSTAVASLSRASASDIRTSRLPAFALSLSIHSRMFMFDIARCRLAESLVREARLPARLQAPRRFDRVGQTFQLSLLL